MRSAKRARTSQNLSRRRNGATVDPLTRAKRRDTALKRAMSEEEWEDRQLDYIPSDELPAWPHDALEERR